MKCLRVARVLARRASRRVRSLPARSGLACLIRRQHDSVRAAVGGRRCRNCGFAAASLADMGELDGSAYISPTRRVFSRENRELSRTAAFEPTRRGW